MSPMTPGNRGTVALTVQIAALLLAVLILPTGFIRNVNALGETINKAQPTATAAAAHDTSPSPQHQVSVLNRLWWRNLEEEDAFIQSLFRKPLASANVGMITGAAGSDGSAVGASTSPQKQQQQNQQPSTRGKGARSRAIAHHAPANSTGPEKRLFIPKLHLVYTVTNEQKRALEVEAASEHVAEAATASRIAAETAGSTSYTQRLRSLLPLSFRGLDVEMETSRPLTSLQAVALHSPIAPLRAYVIDHGRIASSTLQNNNEAGGQMTSEEGIVSSVTTVEDESYDTTERQIRAVKEAIARDAADVITTHVAREHMVSSAHSSVKTANRAAAGTAHDLHQTQNTADETLVVVNSVTKAVVPLTITGTSYTVVQFDGKAGNTINAVVQLKDHRYNEAVSPNNCMKMYLRVELRNHLRTGGGSTNSCSGSSGCNSHSSDDLANVHASTQPHAYIDRNEWGGIAGGRAGAAAVTPLNDGADGGNSDDDPDISTTNRGSWATFWDSFALMFDTSALCKVLPSVSMRVSKAPKTEPFYVVLRSSTGYAYESAYYYNTTSGAFYANTMDDNYTCELDLFIEQWPAEKQERLQFLFAFVIPLLVLLLPLPFTMRRADLVQQYMMETDYAEWVWRPPYYLRNRMIEGLKVFMDWVVQLRTAYQQRALARHLFQQQQQQQREEQPQPALVRNGASPNSNKSNGTVRSGIEETGSKAAATPFSLPPLSTEAPQAADLNNAQWTATSATVATRATLMEGNADTLPLSPLEHHHSSDDPTDRHPPTEDGALQYSRSPHRELKKAASAASSPSSSVLHFDRSSSGSTSLSDFDDGLDGRCPAHHDPHFSRNFSVSGERSDCNACRCSILYSGAVSPPQTTSAQERHQYLANGALPAGQHSTPSPSTSSLSSRREPNNRRPHRCPRHLRSGGSNDGASRAVSVHVPFSMESPVVNTPRGGNNNISTGGKHRDAHDLLFTTAEATDDERRAGTLGAQQQQQRQQQHSREEAEAARTQGQPDKGTVERSINSGSNNKAVNVPASPQKNNACEGRTVEGRCGDDGDEPFCRICREGNDVAPLIAPCGCTGSVRFVHVTCLDRWRLESAKRNLANVNHCEICKMPFTVTIQRSTLFWESSQHLLRGVCLFFTCFLVVVLTTTLTHGILGELSCLASYHEVAYSTMFRFEGLSLSLFVYALAVLLVLFANLIVYSWFRSRPEVAEYVEEMHAIPPFYTRRNMILIVLVCLLLLAQVHATGFLLKYFLYKTSHLVWSWETSPLVGGMLFSLFTTCSITICSWGRQMYMLYIVNGGGRLNPAEVVVVENAVENNNNNENNGNDRAAPPPPASASLVERAVARSADNCMIPTSTRLNYHTLQASPGPQPNDTRNNSSTNQQYSNMPAPTLPTAVSQNRALGMASPQSAPLHVSPRSLLPVLGDETTPQSIDEDVSYTHHFAVPPEQRVIRAFEYCPPHRKVPK